MIILLFFLTIVVGYDNFYIINSSDLLVSVNKSVNLSLKLSFKWCIGLKNPIWSTSFIQF